MKTNFEMVEEFHKTYGQEVLTTAQFPDKKTQEMRIKLIEEEFNEFKDGIDNKDIVEIADALTDLLYVVYGAGHAFGINLDKTFEEVHRSNMSKLGEDGKPIYREDGKVMKGPNYFKPDLKELLRSLGARI